LPFTFPLQGSSGLGRGSLLPLFKSLIQRLALVLLHGDPAKHGKDSFLLPRFCYHSQRLRTIPAGVYANGELFPSSGFASHRHNGVTQLRPFPRYSCGGPVVPAEFSPKYIASSDKRAVWQLYARTFWKRTPERGIGHHIAVL